MNVLITGATGFIGQHLLEELAGDDLQIKIISRQQYPAFWCRNKNFKIIQADISDKQSLKEAFLNTDVVINLAAEIKNTENLELTNILGTKNIVELSQGNNVKKVIHLSSVGVVGMQYSLTSISVDENTSCNPKNEYERTKLESEKIISNSKIPFVILRPTNVFGDHHPRKALLGFFQRMKNGNSFPIKKEAIVNYVYVKDVAHAISFFLLNNTENKTINIGEAIPLKDFIAMAAKELSVTYKIKNLPSAFFSGMETFGYFGVEKLKEKLRGVSNCVEYKDEFMKKNIGYKYGLQRGIKKSIKYYTNQELVK
jgi:nucleoside-diphosphate-sugar epimerase